MTTLAHISDIHFGAVDVTAANHLATQINALNVDGVIVTGDLTQAGRKREFAEAADYLKSFTAPTLVVPGNHDVPVYNLGQRFTDPWQRYRKHISTDLSPANAFGDAFVMGLNSARRAGPSFDWSLGRVSRAQLALADQSLRDSNAGLKIVALHHPVVPAPGRAGEALINSPERALNSFRAAGADLVMTGHAHIAQAVVKETDHGPIVVTAAGTASSTRLRGELPSYNLIRWDGDILMVETHRYGPNGYDHEQQHQFYRNNADWQKVEQA